MNQKIIEKIQNLTMQALSLNKIKNKNIKANKA